MLRSLDLPIAKFDQEVNFCYPPQEDSSSLRLVQAPVQFYGGSYLSQSSYCSWVIKPTL